MDSLQPLIDGILTVGIPAVLAITLHEAAHGYVALAFGDPTAAERGRLSINPLRHIDPMGTVILPLMLLLAHSPFMFGWAKPVPVNFARLRNPRRDMVWVAAAGPGINIVLAILSAVILRLMPETDSKAVGLVAETLGNSLLINVVLAVFNMLPIPPLDGGRVAVGLLPLWLARPLARLEKYGMLILLTLLIGLPWLGSRMGVDLSVFSTVVGPIVDRVVHAIAALTGLS